MTPLFTTVQASTALITGRTDKETYAALVHTLGKMTLRGLVKDYEALDDAEEKRRLKYVQALLKKEKD